MKEHPVLFSTPMVQALLNTKPGSWPAKSLDPSKPFKSMTRRVVKPQPDKDDPCVNYCTVEGFQASPEAAEEIWAQTEKGESVQLKSKYQEGDILWVRETWLKADDGFHYRADATPASEQAREDYGYKWRPSIHMPREAARLFLEVKNVRIERVREIMPEDKKREGFSDCHRAYPCAEYNECNTPCFMKTWDTLNAKRGYSWERNPWVWVIEFMRIK
jgi:hypothetical protein